MKIINCQNNNNSPINSTISEICQRHMLVFGENIQSIISNLTIGVVSTGGLGTIIIEQLMRLFPKKIVFIDNDAIEISNLNRLVGATKEDVKEKVSKVDLVTRNILTFNPEQNFTSINGDFLERNNQEQFKECDFIFGVSDSNAVRIASNHLCLAHGIYYLDCGVGANVENKRLQAAGGQIIIIKPNSGFCLHCSDLFHTDDSMNDFLSEDERKREENQGYVRGTNITAPQVYSLNMMVGSWAVWIFKKIVSGENLSFDGLAIDAKNFKTYSWIEEKKKENNCPTCGINGIVFNGDDVDLLCKDTDDEDFNNDVVRIFVNEKIECDVDSPFLTNTHILIADDRSNQFYSKMFNLY